MKKFAIAAQIFEASLSKTGAERVVNAIFSTVSGALKPLVARAEVPVALACSRHSVACTAVVPRTIPKCTAVLSRVASAS